MPSPERRPQRVTVAIVGAGPAGIGMARVLHDLGVPDVTIFERKEVGASFRLWPQTTRFITPSFPSNAFGLVDLNAVSFDSSPAYAVKREHLSGAEYAFYLDGLVEAIGLEIVTGINISSVEPAEDNLVLHTQSGEIHARFVVWAAGQFQYPNTASIEGAEHGIHSSQIRLWSEFPGQEVTIVGGYESGIDAAIGLATAGKKVTLLSRSAPWHSDDVNPGIALSPLTAQRLNAALQLRHPINLIDGADIVSIERVGKLIFLKAADGRQWQTETFPVLATGFCGSTSLIGQWLERDTEGRCRLSENDESTVLSGLFLVGPEVCHAGRSLSFIYEFRQRFAAVGHAIAERLGLDTAPLNTYRSRNMFLDDQRKTYGDAI